MKTLYAAIAASALILGAQPAFAADDKFDVSELTCEEFGQFNEASRGLIMMWFEGYYTEEDEDATIDFSKMASHLAKLLIACKADPSKKVLDLADDAMED